MPEAVSGRPANVRREWKIVIKNVSLRLVTAWYSVPTIEPLRGNKQADGGVGRGPGVRPT